MLWRGGGGGGSGLLKLDDFSENLFGYILSKIMLVNMGNFDDVITF